jgi:hypothetical protein
MRTPRPAPLVVTRIFRVLVWSLGPPLQGRHSLPTSRRDRLTPRFRLRSFRVQLVDLDPEPRIHAPALGFPARSTLQLQRGWSRFPAAVMKLLRAILLVMYLLRLGRLLQLVIPLFLPPGSSQLRYFQRHFLRLILQYSLFSGLGGRAPHPRWLVSTCSWCSPDGGLKRCERCFLFEVNKRTGKRMSLPPPLPPPSPPSPPLPGHFLPPLCPCAGGVEHQGMCGV